LIYKLPLTQRSSPKKHLAVVFPDTHIGYTAGVPAFDPCALDVALQALEHYAADGATHFIHLGDLADMESCSHWASLRAEQVFIEQDVRLTNAYLDEVDEICDHYGLKKIFIEGNHETRTARLEAKYPMIRDMVNLKKRLFGKRTGWTWVPNNHYYKLGKLYFTHGNLSGVSDSASMLRVAGKSVLFGHNHQHQVARHRTLDGLHVAMSSGCLASIDPPPPYSQAKIPATWAHGFTVVQFRANGLFSLRFHEIIDAQYCEMMDGTEIRTNHSDAQWRLDRDQEIMDQCRNEYEERFYSVGGNVTETEPIKRTEYSSRTQRARVTEGR